MANFAYPNVLPRQKLFIGCGRYGIFSSDAEDSAYGEIHDAPATPNRNTLKRAVQLLAADSYQTSCRLFHLQDQEDQKYQGDSLDLAWLLAKIHCTREINHQISGDIWCTGVIELDHTGVHLLDVNSEGFTLKLEAFLSMENSDCLFLVPLANMEAHIICLCKQAGVEIQPLASCSASKQFTTKNKRIITIAANEMPLLLEKLFKKKNKKRIIHKSVVMFCLLIGMLLYANKAVNTEKEQVIENKKEQANKQNSLSLKEIRSSLENGEFSPVREFIRKMAQQKECLPAELQFYKQLQKPLSVEAKMKYRLSTGQTNEVIFAKKEKPPLLNSKDYYRFTISPKQNTINNALWLYLVQVDSKGEIAMLFPNSSLGVKNPIQTVQWPIELPYDMEQWFVLDKVSRTDVSQTNKQWLEEKLYLLVSSWKPADIEELCKTLEGKPDNKKNLRKILKLIQKREEIALPSFIYLQYFFRHSKEI